MSYNIKTSIWGCHRHRLTQTGYWINEYGEKYHLVFKSSVCAHDSLICLFLIDRNLIEPDVVFCTTTCSTLCCHLIIGWVDYCMNVQPTGVPNKMEIYQYGFMPWTLGVFLDPIVRNGIRQHPSIYFLYQLSYTVLQKTQRTQDTSWGTPWIRCQPITRDNHTLAKILTTSSSKGHFQLEWTNCSLADTYTTLTPIILQEVLSVCLQFQVWVLDCVLGLFFIINIV